MATVRFTLFSTDEELVDLWRENFAALVPADVRARVSIVHRSFEALADTPLDCLVSPANSFGRFDGG